jgi:hypothetical protein
MGLFRTRASDMRRAYAYLLAIGLGLLVLSLWLHGCWRSAEKLDTPAALAQRVRDGASTEERVAAARGLTRCGAAARQEIRRALAESRDAPPEVRCALLEAAMKIRDWRSLPEVFAAMDDADVAVRGRGGAAAREISGADNRFRADDPPEKRGKLVNELREAFQRSGSNYAKAYPDQEE